MTSAAISAWRGTRTNHLDQLEEAHAALRTGGAGRQWKTEQINLAMLVRLTSEFQGFARDLHDEAADTLAVGLAAGDLAVESVLRGAFIRERTVDKGNPHPSGLAKDFLALGLQLWPQLRSVSADAPEWNVRLGRLVETRNAIAHDNAVQLAKVEADGMRLRQFRTFQSYRRSMGKLAEAMDTVVTAHCQSLCP